MAPGRLIPHHDEAIVLRTWPFHEADLLVSLFTREQGKVKGIARHAMKSRKRFGGALEPGTFVAAHYTERPREELVRCDSFEILWSPMSQPVDLLRTAGLQLVVEVLEEALPDLATDDNVFRLAVTALRGMGPSAGDTPGAANCVWASVTYFGVWMCRLMGWWPEFGHCVVCGLELAAEDVWWSSAADGVTCIDDRRSQSRSLSAAAVIQSYRMARLSLEQLISEETNRRNLYREMGVFAVAVLERHLQRKLRSAAALDSALARG